MHVSPIAHVKDRGEVSGGGKKPWKQKGTGRARHGSTRSPIWRHGGVTHGPRNERDFSQKINKKMRVAALYSILAKKYSSNEVLFVSEMSMKEPKTATAKTMVGSLGSIDNFKQLKTRRKNALYLVLPENDSNVKKSFRNMGNVLVGTVRELNPVDLMSYRFVAFVSPKAVLDIISAKSS